MKQGAAHLPQWPQRKQPVLSPGCARAPRWVRHWWLGRNSGTGLLQASQDQMAESGGSLRGPLPRLPLQMNAKHALPPLPPQGKKKTTGAKSSSLHQATALDSRLQPPRCGGEGHGHCLQAACLALPFTQPPSPGGSHGRSQRRFPCQPHAAAFSRPLGPPVLTKTSQAR